MERYFWAVLGVALLVAISRDISRDKQGDIKMDKNGCARWVVWSLFIGFVLLLVVVIVMMLASDVQAGGFDSPLVPTSPLSPPPWPVGCPLVMACPGDDDGVCVYLDDEWVDAETLVLASDDPLCECLPGLCVGPSARGGGSDEGSSAGADPEPEPETILLPVTGGEAE